MVFDMVGWKPSFIRERSGRIEKVVLDRGYNLQHSSDNYLRILLNDICTL